MGEFPDQLIVADHHSADLWEFNWTNARFTYYNVTGTPTVVFDGIDRVVGAGSCSSAASAYRVKINQRLNNTGGLSPVDIDGVYSSSPTTVSMNATFTKLDAVTLQNPRAYLLVLEDHLLYGGTDYVHITRAAYEQAVTLTNVGDEVTVSYDFAVTGWNLENIDCIAFLQSNATKEVYQSARLPMVADFNAGFSPSMASVPEGNGVAQFQGSVTNITDASDQLTFSLNNTWGWAAEFRVEGDAGYHTTPVTKTVGPGQTLDMDVRVTTDAAIRIGEGFQRIYSATSERTQSMKLRVFNGSPSILVVDDDGVRDDEAVVLSALTAKSYLYDHWDVLNDHSDKGPELEDLLCYDIVLWHNGWANAGLTAQEVQDVMDYMDAGGGFILSSQDALSYLTPGVFTSDYLGVQSWVTNEDADQATGMTGDPITDGMSFNLTYPQQNLERPDALTASPIGTVIFRSENSDNIAMRADNGITRSVFLAYAVNAMSATPPDPNNLKTVLDRSIIWIMQSSGQDVADTDIVPVVSRIRTVEPNPFSPMGEGRSAATVRLRISERAANHPARLDVIDLNGRLVRNLLDAPLPAGVATASWDGRNAGGQPAGAGVYYLRFVTEEGTQGARMVLMR